MSKSVDDNRKSLLSRLSLPASRPVTTTAGQRVSADLAARIALHHQRVPKTLAARVTELADNGMSPFEVSHITGLPLPLIRLILRGAPPSGVTK